MNWIEVIVLAVVEGLTEFLPVSSTGHMIIASKLLRISHSDFLGSFEIVIQLGAILAILTKYWSLIWQKKNWWPLILAAFIPTSILGFIGYKLVKTVFLGNVDITMAGLLIGGVLLIVSGKWEQGKQTIDGLSVKQAGIIGLMQAVAIIPGISRSASTIIGGQLSGLSRKSAVEFSFLLGLPVLAAASGYDLMKSGMSFSLLQWEMLGLGLVIAFVVARLTVDWLLNFVEKRSLSIFGWYRILVAVIYFTSQLVFGR